MSEFKRGEKIGGWLILLAIGMISGILMNIITLKEYATLFGNPAYSLNVAPKLDMIITSDFVGQAVFMLVSIYLLFLLFAKKEAFPKHFIILTVVSQVYAIGIIIALKFQDAIGSGEILRVAVGVVVAVIWISYMLKSKRVKATFIN